MAEIRKFRRTKLKKEPGQKSYLDKIRSYRMTHIYSFIIIAVLLIGIIALVVTQYRKHVYTAYDVVSSVDYRMVDGTVTIALGDSILNYSKDGAHCTDTDGNDLWNQTYEMQSLLVSVNGDVVAIGNYNGHEIYVLDSQKKLGEITTTMPIRQIAVAANGRVAVSVADSKVTWVYIYEADGTMAYEIKTTMNQSGYPLGFTFSPDGELLALSCVYVDSGVVKSRIAFYNFGPVGENKSDFFVNGYNYPDTIFPYVKFIDNENAVAVGDNRIDFFSGSHIPQQNQTYFYEDEVQSVYANGNYVGILFPSDQIDARHKIRIFSRKGEMVGDFYTDMDFDDILFGQDVFTIYNENQCVIKTYKDVVKYEGTFAKPVYLMMPVGNHYKYTIITQNEIETIQLK